MPSELTPATPDSRAAHRNSLITTSSLLVVLAMIMQDEWGSSHRAARSTLLHVAILFAVTSFVMQAVAACRTGLRWPARIAPASFAAGIAIMELASLTALRAWSVALTDLGSTALLVGVLALGLDIVLMFRSPPLKS